MIGEQKTYEVYTDENGVYEISDLPPGKYSIQTDTPPGLKIRYIIFTGEKDYSDRKSPKVVLKEKSCVMADFNFSSDTAIIGKVFGADGHAMPNVCLSLQPKGKTVPYTRHFACTNNQGRYGMTEIPSGEYIIVVNYDGKISSNQPFPMAYYPGVFEKDRARVLTIVNGDRLEDIDIHLQSQENRNVLQGILLYSDGRPVPNEFVEFQAETVKPGYDGKVHTRTDEQGRFSLNVLRGLKGRLSGFTYTYSGQYVNCPQIEKLIEEKGGRGPTIESGRINMEVTTDVQGIKLIFPFPYCVKAKRE